MLQHRQAWTEQDKAEIRRLAGKVSPSELARHLDRTETATLVQASKLGIKITLGSRGGRLSLGSRRKPAPSKVIAQRY